MLGDTQCTGFECLYIMFVQEDSLKKMLRTKGDLAETMPV